MAFGMAILEFRLGAGGVDSVFCLIHVWTLVMGSEIWQIYVACLPFNISLVYDI